MFRLLNIEYLLLGISEVKNSAVSVDTVWASPLPRSKSILDKPLHYFKRIWKKNLKKCKKIFFRETLLNT